ncbi:type III-B CRISPR-associated protein Cas10/Cmr2 [Thioalkalicoccus limnaeus]|uniref:Type III-B CRISPR-associated protein Cas10/Cmr2 n=1 Tax=Thioalkalicoccus limnaeus TaxID=120681 RepID=A0ABV4BGG5_9GAMM
MDDNRLWQTKLLARLHDPAEKALVLLRDPAGHEGGTSRALQRLLGIEQIAGETLPADSTHDSHTLIFEQGVSRSMYEVVKRADWLAAAADRPQWPMGEITVSTKRGQTRTLKVADWAQVNWAKRPVLIHPLTGTEYDLGRLGGLSDTDFHDIKSRSLAHFARLIARAPDGVDWRKSLLAIWRFGSELQEQEDFGKLGALWRLLPADTRVPDHSIWDHLDLVSAFGGAAAADPDGETALLALSIGPVQPFIRAARSTSDLWAGSHLLARLAWEAMRPVCETLGPDAILFPRLRGVPQVDLWLRTECGLDASLFEDCDWTRGGTDSNPLFSAALPNRFVALVPRARVADLASTVEQSVRGWLDSLGKRVVDRLLDAVGLANGSEQYCHQQMRDQLHGFPEVHWAAVPFSLIRARNPDRQTDLDTSRLSDAIAPFFGVAPGEDSGFLQSPAWRVLQREACWADGTTFFAPNPGVLYPAVYDLAERVLAAAKAVRPFGQSEQRGWRCSLTGETEWLTTDPEQLETSYRRQTDTLWARVARGTRVARARPSWAKPGEHLGALPAIKRLWPTLFAEEVREAVGGDLQRFVVSTHTMALAHQIDQWLAHGGQVASGWSEALKTHQPEAVALPRRLVSRYQRQNPEGLADAKRLVGLLEIADGLRLEDEKEAQRLKDLVEDSLSSWRKPGERVKAETYYALLLMDGDRMGAWLSGETVSGEGVSYRQSFHPDIRAGFDRHATGNRLIEDYGRQTRALSPNRHLAISGALNDFALTLVRHVVEVEHLGRVIYAGGDDVLAMLPVGDLLPAMQRLRWAYSGHDPSHRSGDRDGLVLSQGFALLDKRLLRLMGEKATASCGAVIAHHQAPLGAVLRELRAAEQQAKTRGGRDAFSLTLLKRSGGIRQFTAKWGEPLQVLSDLRAFLGAEGVSRRAVYNSLAWLKDLPDPQDDGTMLERMLAYQLARQTRSKALAAHHDVPGLARRLTALTLGESEKRLEWLANVLGVAEFLARETRNTDND